MLLLLFYHGSGDAPPPAPVTAGDGWVYRVRRPLAPPPDDLGPDDDLSFLVESILLDLY